MTTKQKDIIVKRLDGKHLSRLYHYHVKSVSSQWACYDDDDLNWSVYLLPESIIMSGVVDLIDIVRKIDITIRVYVCTQHGGSMLFT